MVKFCYRPQRNCGKVMFLHLSVILFTGGCLPQWHAGIHPPRANMFPCPVHAGIYTSLPSACWDTHGYCCGRYTSYWNAFLFIKHLAVRCKTCDVYFYNLRKKDKTLKINYSMVVLSGCQPFTSLPNSFMVSLKRGSTLQFMCIVQTSINV